MINERFYSTVPEKMMFRRASLSSGNVFVQSAGGQPRKTSIHSPAHPLAPDLIINSSFLSLFTEKSLYLRIFSATFYHNNYSSFTLGCNLKQVPVNPHVDFQELLLSESFGVENASMSKTLHCQQNWTLCKTRLSPRNVGVSKYLKGRCNRRTLESLEQHEMLI